MWGLKQRRRVQKLLQCWNEAHCIKMPPVEYLHFVTERYQKLGSTNTFARKKIQKALAANLSEKTLSHILDGHVIVARLQTQGRGTRNHLWVSNEGNLFLSIILPLAAVGLDLQACVEPLSLTTGEGVARMVRRFCSHQEITVKWPNDVLIDGLKVSGTLIELEPPYAIVGIGVDVVSAPLNCRGTFLNRYAAAEYEEVLQALLQSLSEIYTELRVKGFAKLRKMFT